MSALTELQQGFQQYLLHDQSGFEQHIVGTQEAQAEHRLAVYFNAYRARLIECLATDFRGLQKLLGEETFEDLALKYLQQHPSKNPSVRWIGQHLAQFLASQSPWSEQPWLAEMAQFEWHQSLVFCGPEPHQEPIGADALQNVEAQHWPGLRFSIIDNLQFQDTLWNAIPLWMQLENGDPVDAATATTSPQRWAIWRPQADPHWRSLEVHEAWALEQAQNGSDFGALCEGLTEWIDAEHTPMAAASLLQQWIQDRWIEALIIPK